MVNLILLDVVMPGIDGGSLAASLRANRKPLEGVPIVFLTAAAAKEEVSTRGGMIGGSPFLAKPVDLAEVLRCLKTQLAGASQ